MNDPSNIDRELKPLPGSKELAEGIEIRDARLDEIPDLMPLLRAYCDFYECDPTDDGLKAFAEKRDPVWLGR